ncbi:MAG: flagellin [Thermaerobacter sp.]|nr:flagellin [Thermaerobacter sp.]
MYVNNNAAALNAWFNLNSTTTSMQNTLAQLSSGYKINTAADNPAGLAIAQNMLAQANGLSQGSQNAQNGVSLLQTGDGALNQIQNILQSMYQLASEGASGTMNATDTAALQAEMNQYAKEITQITNNTTFNNVNLLSGQQMNNREVQIGANENQYMRLTINKSDAFSLGVTGLTGNLSGTAIAPANSGKASLGTSASQYAVGSSLTAGSSYKVALKYTPFTAGSVSNSTDVTTASFKTGSKYTGSTANTYDVVFKTTSSSKPPASATVYVNGSTTGQKVAISGGTTTNASLTLPGTQVTLKLTMTAAASTTDSTKFTLKPATTNYAIKNAGNTVLASETLNGSQKNATITLQKGSNFYFSDTAANVTTASLAASIKASTAPTATSGSYTLKASAGGKAAGSVNTTTGVANASAKVGLNIQTQAGAEGALGKIVNAINQVSTTRGNVGALMNRLQFAYNDNQITSQNLTNARAGIMDADMAMEMATLSQQQVLQQSGVAMLAQANALPQALLRLLT